MRGEQTRTHGSFPRVVMHHSRREVVVISRNSRVPHILDTTRDNGYNQFGHPTHSHYKETTWLLALNTRLNRFVNGFPKVRLTNGFLTPLGTSEASAFQSAARSMASNASVSALALALFIPTGREAQRLTRMAIALCTLPD